MSTSTRPFAVVFGLIVATSTIAGLAFQEELPRRPSDDRTEVRAEPLRQLTYSPSMRRSNFTKMGLSPEDAEAAAERAKRLLDRREESLVTRLEEQSADVGVAFCPEPSQLPVIYGALKYLVFQEGKVRGVINGFEILKLQEMPWYEQSGSVRPVYDALEPLKQPRPDATVMGLAAIFTFQEQRAVEHRGAWSNGFLQGNLDSVASDHPEVRQKLIEYLALVHVLAEIANRPDGICSSGLL